MLIVLLSFSSFLACLDKVSERTKRVSLNDKPYMVIHTLIDLNPVEFKYYPFMFNLGKCSGSCHSGNNLSTTICVPSKTKT